MALITVVGSTVLAAWRTNSLVTAHLVEQLPAALWDASIPGVPRRTVRTIAAHLHNARSRWLRTLGQEHGLAVPPLVDLRRVTRRSLLSALKRSGRGIEELLELGHRGRRRGSRLEGLCLAQPAAGRRARAGLFRGARGTPPGTDRDGGSATRPSASARGDRWAVAVDRTGAGMATRALMPERTGKRTGPWPSSRRLRS